MGRLTIISGSSDSGKTTRLAGAALRWPPGAIAGCLSLKCRDAGGAVAGYDLLTLSAPRRRIALCRRQPGGPGWLSSGRWMFNPLAFAAALGEIDAIARRPSLVVIDEFGPLELAGGGLLPLLRAALASPAPVAVAMRPSLRLLPWPVPDPG